MLNNSEFSVHSLQGAIIQIFILFYNVYFFFDY